MSGSELTMHVRFGDHAICRPRSLTATLNSNNCQQCERKLERLLIAACRVVSACEASDLMMNQQKAGNAIRNLRHELERCNLGIDETCALHT